MAQKIKMAQKFRISIFVMGLLFVKNRLNEETLNYYIYEKHFNLKYNI